MTGSGVRSRLDGITERLARATAGPWDRVPGGADGGEEIYVPNGTMSTETVLKFAHYLDCDECARPSNADAELIAAAPSDLAALAGAVEAVLALADEWAQSARVDWCADEICRAVAAHLDPKENPNG